MGYVNKIIDALSVGDLLDEKYDSYANEYSQHFQHYSVKHEKFQNVWNEDSVIKLNIIWNMQNLSSEAWQDLVIVRPNM